MVMNPVREGGRVGRESWEGREGWKGVYAKNWVRGVTHTTHQRSTESHNTWSRQKNTIPCAHDRAESTRHSKGTMERGTTRGT